MILSTNSRRTARRRFNQQVKDVLLTARTILESSPRAWIKGVSAKTVKGIKVSPNDSDACRFCSVGALMVAIHELNANNEVADEAEYRLTNVMGNIISSNDDPKTRRNHVLMAFDLALLDTHNRGSKNISDKQLTKYL